MAISLLDPVANTYLVFVEQTRHALLIAPFKPEIDLGKRARDSGDWVDVARRACFRDSIKAERAMFHKIYLRLCALGRVLLLTTPTND